MFRLLLLFPGLTSSRRHRSVPGRRLQGDRLQITEDLWDSVCVCVRACAALCLPALSCTDARRLGPPGFRTLSLYTPTRSAWPPSCPLSPGRELRHGQASSPCVSPLGGRSSAVPAVQCLETAASNIWLIFSEGRRGNDHSIVAKAFAVYSLMERDSRYIHIKNTTCHNICHQQR